jgi:hypothetical protein
MISFCPSAYHIDGIQCTPPLLILLQTFALGARQQSIIDEPLNFFSPSGTRCLALTILSPVPAAAARGAGGIRVARIQGRLFGMERAKCGGSSIPACQAQLPCKQ